MTSYYKIGLTAFCLITSLQSYSQSWKSIVTSLCTDQNEGVSSKMYNGSQYFTGVYRGNMSIGFNSISGWAFDDIFIGKSDLNGYTSWLINIKGDQIDRSNHIDVINNQIVVSGTFSDSLFIGNDTLVNPNQRSVFMAFFDTLGNHISTFVPDVYNAEFRHFQEDGDGNILIVGDFYNQFNYGGFSMTSTSGLNFFLAKYDPVQDSILWAVQATQGSSEGKRISIDQNNNVYVVGLYNEGSYFIDTLLLTGNGNHNLFVSKFDTDGNKLWIKTVEGIGEVHGYGIATDTASNVFLIGEFEGNLTIGGNLYTSGGFYDAMLVKFDQNGSVLWSEAFGGSNSDEGYDIVLDDNMDPIIMIEAGEDVIYKGQTLSVNGWNEPMLLKVKNDNGDLIWYKSLASTTTSGLVNGMTISREGNFIALTGINRSSILFNGNSFVSANMKDFYAVILEDSLTYFLDLDASIDQPEVLMYPNPATDKITIRSSNLMDKVELFSINGQRISEVNVNTYDYTILLSYIEPGLYIVHATIGEFVCQRKILVR